MGIFAFAGLLTLQIASVLVSFAGLMIQAVMAVFAAAAVANGIALRVFERGNLNDIGLAWRPASFRNFGVGLGGGLGSALAVTLLPALLGFAFWEKTPGQSFQPASVAFVSVLLLFGAIGEELLFHGYAFQLLLSKVGAFATLLPVGVLFAAAHEANLGSNWLSFFNTFLWGALLGLCFLRSGDLWLAIGVHYGWNLALPLCGVPVSGFEMNTTGWQLKWRIPEIWSGAGYGPEAGLLCTFVVPLLGWALWKAPIQTERPSLIQEALSLNEEE